MSRPVIHAENLSKRYRLGASQPLAGSLRDLFTGRGASRRASFWALRDISFDVEAGQCVGIIGRNGAGKSTLLKVLAQITAPTTGSAWFRGRVGSLLEVGTGFHPELTGRENIFLNGSILGMTRKEIASRFDAIVDFSGTEQFLDTPVKRYSSGMSVRLAFAVAAHLDPEILIIDEVLAVGDTAFRKRCMGKMSDVAKSGRTVLFISHNMAAIESMCDRAIVLSHGKMIYDGSAAEGVGAYLRSLQDGDATEQNLGNREGTGEVRIRSVTMEDETGDPVEVIRSGQSLSVTMEYEVVGDVSGLGPLAVGLIARSGGDVPLFHHHSRLNGQQFSDLPGRGRFTCTVPRLPLVPGGYQLSLTIFRDTSQGQRVDQVNNALNLTVIPGVFYETHELPHPVHGHMLVDADWSHDVIDDVSVPLDGRKAA
ncbi:ABC transporter ATP-binding protein [Mucisphaera calidilacus]|uniref:Teichoic acids export ATP-binding protein TagH n=1 Tax=Mucisphaera calidilacus TaxID=2527982 RepID=A0A518BZ26_9BACT|nr:ABC transporter ATP-binding protein [Mucisphaera calidilacus]QDU72223.1 Teichoic acids export ATP-binding protein TagH [Mucisphaera calidilacus]